MFARGRQWVQESDGLGEKAKPQSGGSGPDAAVVSAGWERKESSGLTDAALVEDVL